jgi:hypothetical protein
MNPFGSEGVRTTHVHQKKVSYGMSSSPNEWSQPFIALTLSLRPPWALHHWKWVLLVSFDQKQRVSCLASWVHLTSNEAPDQDLPQTQKLQLRHYFQENMERQWQLCSDSSSTSNGQTLCGTTFGDAWGASMTGNITIGQHSATTWFNCHHQKTPVSFIKMRQPSPNPLCQWVAPTWWTECGSRSSYFNTAVNKQIFFTCCRHHLVNKRVPLMVAMNALERLMLPSL